MHNIKLEIISALLLLAFFQPIKTSWNSDTNLLGLSETSNQKEYQESQKYTTFDSITHNEKLGSNVPSNYEKNESDLYASIVNTREAQSSVTHTQSKLQQSITQMMLTRQNSIKYNITNLRSRSSNISESFIEDGNHMSTDSSIKDLTTHTSSAEIFSLKNLKDLLSNLKRKDINSERNRLSGRQLEEVNVTESTTNTTNTPISTSDVPQQPHLIEPDAPYDDKVDDVYAIILIVIIVLTCFGCLIRCLYRFITHSRTMIKRQFEHKELEEEDDGIEIPSIENK